MLNPSFYASQSEHEDRVLNAHLKPSYNYMTFSDLMVVAVPLNEGTEALTSILNIYALMTTTSLILLKGLEVNTPLRGGMDAGIAFELASGEIFGPALESAHHMESKLADYPRVLAGDSLSGFLDSLCSENTNEIEKELAVLFSGKCKNMISKDEDGKEILDFIGEEIASFFKQKIELDPEETYRNTFNQIISEHSKSQNAKLSTKLERLLLYFEKRRHFWI